jgi:hypothetical protein
MPDTVTSRRDVALDLAANCGFQIFPIWWPSRTSTNKVEQRCACGKIDCGNVGKHPIGSLVPHGVSDASADLDLIDAWWTEYPNANIGIATGAASGIDVLDEDPRHAGDQSIADLEAEHERLPATVECLTGSGRHRYFRHTPGLRCSNGGIAAGIDFKTTGGYVVGHGSLHATGRAYQWELSSTPDEETIAPLPEWLRARIPKHEPPASSPASVNDNGSADGAILGGNRHKTLISIAGALRHRGCDQETIVAALHDTNRKRCRPPKSDDEIEKIAASFMQYAPGDAHKAKIADTPSIETIEEPGAALNQRFEDAIAGRLQAVKLPWSSLTNGARPLLPGTASVLCGMGGSSKSFLTLQAAMTWYKARVPFALLELEDDRGYHLQRALAQLERRSELADLDWVKDHPDESRAALARHEETIAGFGANLYDAPDVQLDYDGLLRWIEERAAGGCRIIGIDPVTAIEPSREPWLADQEFIIAAKTIAKNHGVSLWFVTHPRKSSPTRSSPGTSLDDIAGGAAWARFSHTVLMLEFHAAPKDVTVSTPLGSHAATINRTLHIRKTRNGPANGAMIGMTFDGSALLFNEEGVVHP